MADPNLTGIDEHIIESPFKSPRNIALTAVVLSVLAAVLYTVWWFWLASEVRETVDAWVERMRIDGRQAAYDTLTIEGYPGALAIRIGGVAAADPDGGWQVRVPALNALMKPWAIGELSGTADGPFPLDITRGAAPGRYIADADANALRIDRDGGGRVRLDISGLTVSRLDVPDPLKVARVTATLIRGALPVYGRGTVDAQDIGLPPDMHSAFGGHIARFKVTAEATGAKLPEGINAGSLRRWTGDGGAIDIKSVEVSHGVLGLAGEGTMALDGDLQPIGAFTAAISGFNEAVDALVAAGAARPQDGALAKVVLGVLAKAPPGGGPKVVSLPLSLQDRRLSVGPIPLITLRRIDWE